MADFGHDGRRRRRRRGQGQGPLGRARPRSSSPACRNCWSGRWRPGGCGSPPTCSDISRPEPATAEPAVHFVCVGHPAAQGRVRRRHHATSRPRSTALLPHLRPGDLVVGKSTVPVGTAAGLAEQVTAAAPGAMLAWNPEFLREGHAVDGHPAPGPARLRPARRPRPGRGRREALLDGGLRRPRSPPASPVITADYATRRAGQDRRERLPGHEDLVHQRDGRGVRGRRAPTSRCWPRRSATTTGSARSSSAPGSASAAAACPRTSGRSWPGPASWAPTRR